MKTLMMTGAIAAATVSCAPVQAEPVSEFNVPLNTSYTPLFGGSISNQNFAVTRDIAAGVELGLRATRRDGYSGLAGPNGTYAVQPGTSSTGLFWWDLNFSANLGSRSIVNTDLRLTVEFTPQSGGPSVSLVLNSQQSSPGSPHQFLIWSGSGGSSLLQANDNLGFGSRYSGMFDPNDLGVYTITLEAFDDGYEDSFAAITMAVTNTVIPLPTAAGMTLAGIGLVGMRRRR